MSSVRERTQKEIMDYIRIHSKDGKLTKSLLDIAEDIGYSNTTIHRALKALEEKGLIEINTPDKPTEPNTIIYKGDKNEIDEILAQGAKLSEEIKTLGKKVDEYVNEMNWLIRKLQKELEEKDSLKNRIVHVQDIPDSDLQIITVRK